MRNVSDPNRRRFCGAAAAVASVGALGLPSLLFAEGSTAMNAVAQANSSGQTALRPFRVNFPEADLIELRRRINATRFPDKETVADFTQGVPLDTSKKLARYWANEYDWRDCERRINAHPNFITEIDGLDIHFIHARSKHENALPIIITHGWPGSIVEQMKLIEPLIDPTKHGGKESDAFHVVIPSMPGYGFSGKPTKPGWDCPRMARAWGELMTRLGYTKYVAQGGDWGGLVVEEMAALAPPGLVGIHTNFPRVVPPDIDRAAQIGAPAPSGLSAEEKAAYDEIKFVYTKGIGYGYQLGLRPQSVLGLADSPVGLATYLLDHDARSLVLIARAFNGEPTGLTRDDVLDNVTLFWLTQTAISSGRLYWENKLPYFQAANFSLPVAISAFPDELYPPPRSWVDKAYRNVIHFNKLKTGGHFAAWEQPMLLTNELRVGLRSLRG